jgi:hypothetical protein
MRWTEKQNDRKDHIEWQTRIDLLDCATYSRAIRHFLRQRSQAQQIQHRQKRKYGLVTSL